MLSLIPARSKKYMRTSIILLAGAFMVLGAVLLYVERGYAEQERNFTDNTNLLLVTVTHRESSDTPFESLTSADRDSIAQLVASSPDAQTGSTRAIVSNRYGLGGGVTLSSGDPYFIYGIDPEIGDLIGVPEMQAGHAYVISTNDAPSAGAHTLSIPVVSVEPDGYTSRDLAQYPIVLDASADPARVEYLIGNDASNVMFVSSETFKGLASSMFATDWNTVRTRWEAGELPMTPLVGSIYVYVGDIDDVRAIAATLEGDGYGTSYGLRAFDDVEASLRTSTILAGVTVLVTLGAAAALFVLSWRSYLALSSRDIGILKHWGISDGLIVSSYSKRLTRTCVIATVCGMAVVVVLAPFFLARSLAFTWGAVNIVTLAVVGVVLYQLIVQVAIKPSVGGEVLSLLRENREFQ